MGPLHLSSHCPPQLNETSLTLTPRKLSQSCWLVPSSVGHRAAWLHCGHLSRDRCQRGGCFAGTPWPVLGAIPGRGSTANWVPLGVSLRVRPRAAPTGSLQAPHFVFGSIPGPGIPVDATPRASGRDSGLGRPRSAGYRLRPRRCRVGVAVESERLGPRGVGRDEGA